MGRRKKECRKATSGDEEIVYGIFALKWCILQFGAKVTDVVHHHWFSEGWGEL